MVSEAEGRQTLLPIHHHNSTESPFLGQVVSSESREVSGGPQDRFRSGGFAVSAKRAAKREAPSGSPASALGPPRRRSILLTRCAAEPIPQQQIPPPLSTRSVVYRGGREQCRGKSLAKSICLMAVLVLPACSVDLRGRLGPSQLVPISQAIGINDVEVAERQTEALEIERERKANARTDPGRPVGCRITVRRARSELGSAVSTTETSCL